MVREHNHALGEELHHDCEECQRIVERYPSVERQKKADAMAKRFAQIATKKGTSDDET